MWKRIASLCTHSNQFPAPDIHFINTHMGPSDKFCSNYISIPVELTAKMFLVALSFVSCFIFVRICRPRNNAYFYMLQKSIHGPTFHIINKSPNNHNIHDYIAHKGILQEYFRFCDWLSFRCLVPFAVHSSYSFLSNFALLYEQTQTPISCHLVFNKFVKICMAYLYLKFL